MLTAAVTTVVVTPISHAVTSANLIVNGDAESTQCQDPWTANPGGITGWTTTTGTPNVVCNNYGNGSNFPGPTTPGTQPGNGYFSGGYTYNDGGLTQTVNVANSAGTIDAGTLAYTLSGWLGNDTSDSVELDATFLNAGGTQVGTVAKIGPSNTSSIQFVYQTTTGTIPTGTRTIKLDLISHHGSGRVTDGYADNLSLTTSAIQPTGQNLIVDGGAESAVCSNGYDEMTVPGWTITSGSPDAICYNLGSDSAANASTPGARPGNAYFSGGPFPGSSLSQKADVSAASAAIDAGTATYNLSGWLGGFATDQSNTKLVATFLNSSGSPVGTAAQIGPVTAADRGNVTGFLQRTATGTIPTGTRSIKLDLTFAWVFGEQDGVTDGFADDLSLTISPSVTPATLTVPASTVPTNYDHVFTIFMENTNYASIIGSSDAPLINQLANNNTLLTNYYATTHSSDPNYLAATFGTTFDQSTGSRSSYNNCINNTSCTHPSPNLASRTEDVGKTWKEYDEYANGNCDHTDHGDHDDDTVTFDYWDKMKNDQTYCNNHHQPLPQMYTDLQSTATTPNYVWFGGGLNNNMHNGTVSEGDTWLNDQVNQITSSYTWNHQKCLLVLSWDESAGSGHIGQSPGDPDPADAYSNKVVTILLDSPSANRVKHGYQSNARYDHYSMARTVEQTLGLSSMTNNDKYATPMNDIFN